MAIIGASIISAAAFTIGGAIYDQFRNYFNGIKTDILAKVLATNDEFGTLVQCKVDSPYFILLENTTINSLELSITDENNKIIDFHGMPINYTLEISKKNNL